MTEERPPQMKACPASHITVSYATHLEVLEREKDRHTALHVDLVAKQTQKHEEIQRKLNNEITLLKQSLKVAKETANSQEKERAKLGREIKKLRKALQDSEDGTSRKKRGRLVMTEADITKKARPSSDDEVHHNLSKHELKWNEKLEQLTRFKEEFGHCSITPRTKKCPDEYSNLGVWVTDQRTQHRFLRQGKPSSMTPERIRKLDAIGFQWCVQKSPPLSFGERLVQLKEYKLAHGHCNVPQKCKTSPMGLGNFVLEQRRMYKAIMNGQQPSMKVSTEDALDRIQQMTAMGFEWSLRKRGRGGSKETSSTSSLSQDAEEPVTATVKL